MVSLLIVDDETHLADSLAESLDWSALGIESVRKAYSADEAVALLEEQAVDILLTDIRMPGMSGLELIDFVNRRYSKVKSVLITGHADFSYAKQAVQAQAMDYLLKPVRQEALEQCLLRVMEKIRQEWEEIGSYRRAVDTVRSHLPLIRSSLLEDLLYGKPFASGSLNERFELYEMKFRPDDAFAMMLVRLEDEFAYYGNRELTLVEYAVTNMAEEILAESFEVWHCRDHRDYLVFLVQTQAAGKEKGEEKASREGERPEFARSYLEDAATRLQMNVNRYLKGTISVIVSDIHRFPDDVPDLYRRMVTTYLQRVGSVREMFVTLSDPSKGTEGQSLRTPSESPALLHLLESGKWEAARGKIMTMIDELAERWSDSQAHLYEVYFHIAGAFIHVVHRGDLALADVMGEDSERLAAGPWCRSAKLLGQWSLRHLARIEEALTARKASSQSYAVRQIHAAIERVPLKNLTVQAIADEVRLHPVYLSKIFKVQTGMSISDYLFQLRMDRAEYLLGKTVAKIYEITAELGFQNPNYFAKVFKRYSGMTPQEFRERANLV